MKATIRLLAEILLLALLVFCVFGFVTTYEMVPKMPRSVWRTVYGLVGFACAIGLVRPLRCRWRWFKR